MSSKTFKILGTGIDTGNMIFKPASDNEDSYDYIHTSISKNNDFLVADYIKNQPGASLVVTVDFTDNLEQVLGGHLEELGRNTVDLLLLDCPTFDWSRLQEIFEPLVQEGLVGEVGIANPVSLDVLDKLKDALGPGKKIYVALDICPFKYNVDIMEWIEKEGAVLLSFNPFGGYLNAPTLIESFSIPYLLAFAATHSEIVFLSGRDLFGSSQAKGYLETLVGLENKDVAKYTLKKSTSRLVKPAKRVIGTSLALDRGNFVLSYDIPQFLYYLPDLEISLGKTVDVLPTVPEDLYTTLERGIKDLIDILYFPVDASDNVKYALLRYKVLQHLRFLYPESAEWIMDLTNLGDRILGIKISRIRENGWLKKISGSEPYNVEELSFILALPDKDHPVFLQAIDRNELKNSSEKP